MQGRRADWCDEGSEGWAHLGFITERRSRYFPASMLSFSPMELSVSTSDCSFVPKSSVVTCAATRASRHQRTAPAHRCAGHLHGAKPRNVGHVVVAGGIPVAIGQNSSLRDRQGDVRPVFFDPARPSRTSWGRTNAGAQMYAGERANRLVGSGANLPVIGEELCVGYVGDDMRRNG